VPEIIHGRRDGMLNRTTRRGGLALAVLSLTSLALAQPAGLSPAEAAIQSAARQQKYTFVVFWKQDDAATQAMRQAVQTFVGTRADWAMTLSVQTTDANEKAVVDRFGVSRAPLPLVLALAPNGAITGGFPQKVTDTQLSRAFVSPSMAASLKALQGRKLVLLCVQPRDQAVPAGVREFAADAQYRAATVVVTMDPADASEARHLKDLSVDAARDIPATLLLAPPGRILGKFKAAVTREQLVEKLKSAQSCCPGGKCGPGGCCGPKK
jgi:hypothetical protein